MTKVQEDLFKPNCLRTHSGQYVNVLNPDPDTILIEDIAHSLANQCRFGGHLPLFYSVAQHSVRAANMVQGEGNELCALMHDASEAYLMDIPRPIKNHLSNYKEIEDRFMHVIAAKFGFNWPMCQDVVNVDEELLKYEWESIMLGNGKNVVLYSPAESKAIFLECFHKLQTKTVAV